MQKIVSEGNGVILFLGINNDCYLLLNIINNYFYKVFFNILILYNTIFPFVIPFVLFLVQCIIFVMPFITIYYLVFLNNFYVDSRLTIFVVRRNGLFDKKQLFSESPICSTDRRL